MPRLLHRRRLLARRGLSLAELLVSVAVLTIIAGVLGGLATAVQTSSDYSQGNALAVQHTRVAQERITRAVAGAYSNGSYPSAVAVYEVVGGWRFPDTLVVWNPAAAPANANGPPLVRELVIFCPDPADPRRLLEITAPHNASTIQLNEQLNTPAGRSLIAGIKTASDSEKVVLSNLLRTADVNGATRGCVRFERELRPSDSAWQSYLGGTTPWSGLVWPQGAGGSTAGMRQNWMRYEWQMMPGESAAAKDPSGQQAVTFFGSAGRRGLLNQ